MRRLFPVALMGLLALFSGTARGQPQGEQPSYSATPPSAAPREYVFAVHPLHNPVRLFEIYGPLVEDLNQNLGLPGARFRLEASRNYEEFDQRLYAREYDLALANPYQTLNALKRGYRVIAKMGDDQKFTGIILVRRDSGIRRPSDLKGKKVAYPARSALAACMMPQYFLQTHGVDVNRDLQNRYVGSQESAIMNVYLGETAAGVTWPLPWEAFQKEHPDMARELVVRWETEPLINNSVIARDDVPRQVAERVARRLASLNESAQGRVILERMPLSRFELADDARYQVVEDFVRRFEHTVGPLEP